MERAVSVGRRAFDPEAILERLAAGDSGCGDVGLRIDRRGDWFYQGGKIGRPALVRLFAGVLRRDGHGTYWLVTPGEQCRVEVEDVPFTAVEVAREGIGEAQALRFRTNLDDWIEAGPAHELRCRPGPFGSAPYLNVGRGLEARVLRSVFYELAELAVPGPDDGALGIWSARVFFPLELLPA